MILFGCVAILTFVYGAVILIRKGDVCEHATDMMAVCFVVTVLVVAIFEYNLVSLCHSGRAYPICFSVSDKK